MSKFPNFLKLPDLSTLSKMTRLMVIIFAVCVVFGGGYAIYLCLFVGLSQGAWPEFLAMILLILTVGGITWYVHKNE